MSEFLYNIVVASPSDYERLVAEIFFDGKFVALISQERAFGVFDLEISGACQDQSMIAKKIPLPAFLEAVNEAVSILADKR